MPNVNRFISVGQNTPLTAVFSSGFEYNDSARDGAASVSGFTTTTVSPHNKSGATPPGGTRALALNSGGNYVSIGVPTLREFVMCSAQFVPAASDLAWDASESSGSIQIRIFNDGGAGAISVLRSTATNLGTSAGGAVPADTWNWIHVWGFVDNSAGFAHVKVGSWANNILSVTGADTQQHASNSYMNQTRFQSVGSGTKADDLIVFARSMYYSAGTGAFTVGETITGGTSGATLVVTHQYNNGAGSGVVFVRTVSGTFEAGETLTGGTSGITATAGNALGNDQASLWVDEQYILLATTDSDVLAGWSTSTGAAHYTEVDDAATTADFVSTNTADQVDEFGTSITLPPGARIELVKGSVFARLNGASAVNNLRVGLDDGAGDMDVSEDSALSGAWETHSVLITRNPHTSGDRFTTTEIGNMNIRIISRT